MSSPPAKATKKAPVFPVGAAAQRVLKKALKNAKGMFGCFIMISFSSFWSDGFLDANMNLVAIHLFYRFSFSLIV